MAKSVFLRYQESDVYEEMQKFVREQVASYYSKGQLLSQNIFGEIEKAFKTHDPNRYNLINFEPSIFLKREDSLIRSIIKDMNVSRVFHFLSAEKKESIFDETLDELKDFFRMNFCISEDNLFEDCAVEILQILLKINGIKLRKYINSSKAPYKDSFHHSKNGCKDFKAFLDFHGYPFEVQIHNHSSEDMNLSTHGIYEVYRDPKLKEEHKSLLGEDRARLYQLVISPEFSEDRIVKEGLNYYE